MFKHQLTVLSSNDIPCHCNASSVVVDHPVTAMYSLHYSFIQLAVFITKLWVGLYLKYYFYSAFVPNLCERKLRSGCLLNLAYCSSLFVRPQQDLGSFSPQRLLGIW
jgi:hypothetical protein